MKVNLRTLLENQIGFYNPKFINLIINDCMFEFGIGHSIDYTGAVSSIKLTEIIEEYGDFYIDVRTIEYDIFATLTINGCFVNPFTMENIIKKFINNYCSFGFLCISIYEYDEEAENKEKVIGKYFLNESKLPSTFNNFQVDNIIKDILNPGFNATYKDYDVKAYHIYITPENRDVKQTSILLQIVIEEHKLESEFEDEIFE